jgi:opacity protein-like surface antigen
MNTLINGGLAAALLAASAIASTAAADSINVTKVEWCLRDAMVPSTLVPSAVTQWNLRCDGKNSCQVLYDIMDFRHFLGGDCHDGSPKGLGVWYSCIDLGVTIKEKYFEVPLGQDHVLITLKCP